jgi:hypothetical protein
MRNLGLLLFELFLLVLVVFFVVQATEYNSRARLVPLLFGIPTFCLIVFQIGLDHVPALEKFRPVRKDLTKIAKNSDRNSKDRGESASDTTIREVIMLAWVIGLGIALTLFGFLVVLPIFLLTFLKFAARLSWSQTLISTALASGFLYLTFIWFLQVRFYYGILNPF